MAAFKDYKEQMEIRKQMNKGLKKLLRTAKAKSVKTVFEEFKTDLQDKKYIVDENKQLQLQQKRTMADKTRKISKARVAFQVRPSHLSVI